MTSPLPQPGCDVLDLSVPRPQPPTPGPRFRLVALDVDGTLKPRDGPITERVQSAIAATVAAGVHVTIATGRMFRSALPFAQSLGLRTPIICYGGSVIRDPTTGATIHRQGIPEALARQVVEAARTRGLGVAAYVDDDLYVERLAPGSPFAGYVARASARVVEDVLAHLSGEPCHMAVVSDEVRTRSLVLDLRAEFGGRLSVTSGHPLLAEIDHPEVSKGRALALLAERLGIDRARVLAVGDDWNDITMLEYAGLGIAMGGASPEVLAAADDVAPSVADDGVAWALGKYVLDGRYWAGVGAGAG